MLLLARLRSFLRYYLPPLSDHLPPPSASSHSFLSVSVFVVRLRGAVAGQMENQETRRRRREAQSFTGPSFSHI